MLSKENQWAIASLTDALKYGKRAVSRHPKHNRGKLGINRCMDPEVVKEEEQEYCMKKLNTIPISLFTYANTVFLIYVQENPCSYVR